MNVATIAKLIDVSPDTVRRWGAQYRQFMSPTATPQKGRYRQFTTHDAAVLQYIRTSRENGLEPSEINGRLATMQADGWKELPEIPAEALAFDDNPIDMQTAAVRASQVAEIAVLRSELNHTQEALAAARHALEAAQDRVEALEGQITSLQKSQTSAEIDTQARIHAVQLELERARGEAGTAQARLAAYALTGNQPVPLALIILITAAAAVLLVLLVFVIVRLAG